MKCLTHLILGGVFILLNHLCTGQTFQLLDNKGSVTFVIKNLGIGVQGSIGGLNGFVNWNQKDVGKSNIEGSIHASTLSTGIALRDKHLKKEEYFDIDHYEMIQFRSKKISKIPGQNAYEVLGELTIKKTTRLISFPFKMEESNGQQLLTAQFTIDRKEFGVGGNSLTLANNVSIKLAVVAVPNVGQ